MVNLVTDIPMPEEKIVLLDIDGTILNDQYEVTCNDFLECVQETQRLGWVLGLSSDTPIKTMRELSDEFNMNGPLMAEKGAVVSVNGEISYDEKLNNDFATMRLDVCNHFQSSDIRIWSGDPVKAIRDKEQINNPGDKTILINEHRLCSFGMFARRSTPEGELVIDRSLTERVIEEIGPYYPDTKGLSEDINHESGLLILADGNINKRKGIEHLQRLRPIGKIAMIGNSMSDYLGRDIAIHYAVENADEDFKKKADHVADNPLSSGVVEILRKISE